VLGATNRKVVSGLLRYARNDGPLVIARRPKGPTRQSRLTPFSPRTYNSH
jgi:hypothetical protein